jgi:heme a synthase
VTDSSPQRDYSPWPHRLAVALVCATFPLIWVGGLVTTYDAGMAVPDWPGTYGYNLFLYPWQTWLSGPWDLFIEHGHRLLGALAGMITLAFAASVYLRDQRPWMKIAAVVAVVLVISQGLLGGARVLLDERTLAMVHGCVGPLFFAYAACLAVVTSRRWKQLENSQGEGSQPVSLGLGSLPGLTVLLVALSYLQLVLGAQVRHISVMATPGDFRLAVVFHIVMAAMLLLNVAALLGVCVRRRPISYVRGPILVFSTLMLLQMVLGPATWVIKFGWPMLGESYAISAQYLVINESFLQAIITTGHVAMGSLILATAAAAAVRCLRVHSLTATASLIMLGVLSHARLAGGLEVAR